MTESESKPVVLLSPEEAAARLGVGRTTLYRLLKRGALRSVRVGRLRRVPESEIDAYWLRLVQGIELTWADMDFDLND